MKIFKCQRWFIPLVMNRIIILKYFLKCWRGCKNLFADGLYHLSYGMVELPTGENEISWRYRGGCDDIISEVIQEAALLTAEKAKSVTCRNRKAEIIRKIGLAALKFLSSRLPQRKKMIFDPKIQWIFRDKQAPIQNAYVRINRFCERTAEQK